MSDQDARASRVAEVNFGRRHTGSDAPCRLALRPCNSWCVARAKESFSVSRRSLLVLRDSQRTETRLSGRLFGTTMNQASRMESNGVPGRIHVSKETAQELVSLGKEDWLEKRKDRITAKGLGELDTYFVVVASRSSETNTLGTRRSSFGTTEL